MPKGTKKIPKKKVQFLNSWNSWFASDWIYAATYLTLGVILIQTSVRQNSWKIWVERNYKDVPIANIISIQNSIRFRRADHPAWQDVRDPISLSDGDNLIIEEGDSALLKLDQDNRINISSNSAISFRADTSEMIGINSSNFLTVLKYLFLGKCFAPKPFIEFKYGHIDAFFPEKSSSITLITFKNTLTFDNDAQGARIQFDLPKAGGHSVLSIAPESPSPIKVRVNGGGQTFKLGSGEKWLASAGTLNNATSIHFTKENPSNAGEREEGRSPAAVRQNELNHGMPVVPTILSPLHGARFVSNASEKEDISLVWKKLPLDLKVVVELKRLDDPDFNVLLIPTSSGTVASLPDGHYSWRVRTVNSNNLRSEWTALHDFSIQENIRGAIPVAVLESQKIEKELSRKTLAKEAEEARMAEAREFRAQERQKLNQKMETQKHQKWLISSDLKTRKLELELRKTWLKQKYQPIVEAAADRISKITGTAGSDPEHTEPSRSISMIVPSPSFPDDYSDQKLRRPILFSWKAEPSVKWYEFQLSSDAEFQNLIHQDKLNETMTAVTLDRPGIYFWRIRSMAQSSSSEWSVPRKIEAH